MNTRWSNDRYVYKLNGNNRRELRRIQGALLQLVVVNIYTYRNPYTHHDYRLSEHVFIIEALRTACEYIARYMLKTQYNNGTGPRMELVDTKTNKPETNNCGKPLTTMHHVAALMLGIGFVSTLHSTNKVHIINQIADYLVFKHRNDKNKPLRDPKLVVKGIAKAENEIFLCIFNNHNTEFNLYEYDEGEIINGEVLNAPPKMPRNQQIFYDTLMKRTKGKSVLSKLDAMNADKVLFFQRDLLTHIANNKPMREHPWILPVLLRTVEYVTLIRVKRTKLKNATCDTAFGKTHLAATFMLAFDAFGNHTLTAKDVYDMFKLKYEQPVNSHAVTPEYLSHVKTWVRKCLLTNFNLDTIVEPRRPSPPIPSPPMPAKTHGNTNRPGFKTPTYHPVKRNGQGNPRKGEDGRYRRHPFTMVGPSAASPKDSPNSRKRKR